LFPLGFLFKGVRQHIGMPFFGVQFQNYGLAQEFLGRMTVLTP